MTGKEFANDVFSLATIRTDDLLTLSSWIRLGYCCSLVGISNSGKSLLLKSLTTPKTRELIARDDAQSLVSVLIDCLEIKEDPVAFYELILRRILEEIYQTEISSSVSEILEDIHLKILETTAEVPVRSFFARALNKVIREANITLILILDEIDAAFEFLPSWPFRQLRTLRDSLGEKLCFVTGTGRPLDQIRTDEEIYEFCELFHLHTLKLGQLSKDDARVLIGYLSDKFETQLESKTETTILELSGGHPGLIERTFEFLKNNKPPLGDGIHRLTDFVYRYPPIQKECRRLWHELDEGIQEIMIILLSEGETSIHNRRIKALEELGLVLVDTGNDEIRIFSALFAKYVKEDVLTKWQVMLEGVRYDPKTGQIWVNDREVTLDLSEQQRKLLKYMYENLGTVCTHEQIAIAVYGVGIGVSPAAIQALVTRLRKKIEPDWQDPKYIVNVPGVGYLLEEPE